MTRSGNHQSDKRKDDDQPHRAVLYMVPTPLGNLEDITIRALRILKEVDWILSEDTRKTAILCNHYEIDTPRKSYRVHQIPGDNAFAISELTSGKSLAFVTDAGTPGISDPGSHLVRGVREALPEIPIVPLPGPSALTALLSVTGWQTNPSLFGGFLSIKPGKRRKFLEKWSSFDGVIVLYESVHRIKKLLLEVHEIMPEKKILIGREISKIFEEFVLLPGNMEHEMFKDRVDSLVEKGEFTIAIGPDDSNRSQP